MNIRLLQTGKRSAAENMAIDEAVLESVAKGASLPTLRLYGWKPAAISVGFFQSLAEEVDMEACRASGVEYVRRITGGGAVLHEDEITYSVHLPESIAEIPRGVLESYHYICNGVIQGLSRFGVTAHFVPLNDLVVEKDGMPRKISGNAQTRRSGVILQHGTILLKVDVEKMFALLKVPSEKMKGKLITDIKQRVTSLSDVLGREVGFEEAVEEFAKGFREACLGCDFQEGDLTAEEKARAGVLVKDKYSMDEWNSRR